jgi:hypothetical protein
VKRSTLPFLPGPAIDAHYPGFDVLRDKPNGKLFSRSATGLQPAVPETMDRPLEVDLKENVVPRRRGTIKAQLKISLSTKEASTFKGDTPSPKRQQKGKPTA